MILIADSGSTKTDWRLIKSGSLLFESESVGLNPFFNTIEDVRSVLENLDIIIEYAEQIKHIYFYGAGCSDKKYCNIIRQAFASILPNVEILVEHDLLAAARATCQEQVGIACILGTGSNSCLYDGKEIVENIPALGYVLGDEGSGVDIGKNFIRAFYYKELPQNIIDNIKIKYKWSKADLLENVYFKSFPNRYLASISRIVKEYVAEPFVAKLVASSFDRFLQSHIAKYAGAQKYPINFVGSIAFEFKDILEASLIKNDMQIGKIIKQPIGELVKYHI